MKYKNYYKILDLKGPKVTDDEIKIAYRKLAKKYHPDINPGDVAAQEKFKNINEAYEVLGSKKRKSRYNVRYYMHIMQNGVDVSSIKDTISKVTTSDFVKIFVGDVDKKADGKDKSKKEFLNVEVPISLSLDEAFNRSNKEDSNKTSWRRRKKCFGKSSTRSYLWDSYKA